MNEPGKNTHMKSILIVDDELATRESLRMILKRKYDLLLAASGEEALNTLQTKQPDLILLDIIMPAWTAWKPETDQREKPQAAGGDDYRHQDRQDSCRRYEAWRL